MAFLPYDGLLVRRKNATDKMSVVLPGKFSSAARLTSVARRAEVVKEFVGHVFNVPNPTDFEHVENVLHEKITASPRRDSRSGASCHNVCGFTALVSQRAQKLLSINQVFKNRQRNADLRWSLRLSFLRAVRATLSE